MVACLRCLQYLLCLWCLWYLWCLACTEGVWVYMWVCWGVRGCTRVC